MKREWYRVSAKAEEPAAADLYIFDDIGKSWWNDDTVTAKKLIDEMNELPASVLNLRVHINCLGGDVFEALAIANAFKHQRSAKGRTVEVTVEGIAASAATVVMMGAGSIRISDNALVMIHDPWGCICGNAKEMRKTADAFDKIRDTIVATYQWQSKLSTEELIALIDAETWMNADEAIANGFATEKVEGLKAAACLKPSAMAKFNIPEQYRERVAALVEKPAAPTPAPAAAAATDVLRECTAAGCLDLAEGFVTSGATLDAVKSAVAAAKSAREAEASRLASAQAAENTRTEGIRALCTKANHPELIAGYLSGSMTVDAVKNQLAVIAAKLDKVEIDGNIDPGGNSKPPVDVLGSYVALSKKAAN